MGTNHAYSGRGVFLGLGQNIIGQFGQGNHRILGTEIQRATCPILHVDIHCGCCLFYDTISFDELELDFDQR
jgi:hypothetical protein